MGGSDTDHYLTNSRLKPSLSPTRRPSFSSSTGSAIGRPRFRHHRDLAARIHRAYLAPPLPNCVRSDPGVRFTYKTNLIVLVAIVAAATLLVTQLNGSIVPNLATGATITTSSKEPNTPDPSKFVDGDIFNLGFFTTHETKPWVNVNLGREKLIGRIVLYNRLDCCRNRAIPLVVKVGHNDRDLVQVARIDKEFETWEGEIVPRLVQVIRIESEITDYFSLNEIEVR